MKDNILEDHYSIGGVNITLKSVRDTLGQFFFLEIDTIEKNKRDFLINKIDGLLRPSYDYGLSPVKGTEGKRYKLDPNDLSLGAGARLRRLDHNGLKTALCDLQNKIPDQAALENRMANEAAQIVADHNNHTRSLVEQRLGPVVRDVIAFLRENGVQIAPTLERAAFNSVVENHLANTHSK